jgi:2-oxoacid:acceptor oxidoreductase delta subunit (pyruvate/2-ketoisovalerate family)
LREARRCLANNQCQSCELCRLFCPELCITRNEKTNELEVDYDFCKMCGICVMICPRGAIKMESRQ